MYKPGSESKDLLIRVLPDGNRSRPSSVVLPSAMMEICASDMSKVGSMAYGGSSAYLLRDTVHRSTLHVMHWWGLCMHHEYRTVRRWTAIDLHIHTPRSSLYGSNYIMIPTS